MLIQTMAALCVVAAMAEPAGHAQAGGYQAPKARRHFVSLTYDWQFIQPYSFGKHPLEDLLGQPVDEVHLETFQYRTRDGLTTINVEEYGKRANGLGVTLYPFGSSDGATLAVRASIESLPDIRVRLNGPSPVPRYDITGGRAVDIGAGLEMSDRSAGWGVGGHAFIIGGIGRATTDQMDGRRYWAEGGGGIMFGPFGVDLSVKYTVNRFETPAGPGSSTIPTQVHMIPICVRGTVTF